MRCLRTRRELLKFGLAAAGLSVSGCGYSVRPPGYPDVHTVYVPMFKTITFRRDVQIMLTEAVIKELEERTKYKVVGTPECADTILEGTINFADKNLVVENPQNLPREVNAWVQATVRWIHNPPLEQERTAPPVVVGETVNFIPEVGETAMTGFYKTCLNLATQIVDMMDAPW
jgi:Lipopolysaccharide-assembly